MFLRDTRLLDAEEDEHSPDDIDELNGNKQQPQRNALLHSLDSEGDAVVSDEQVREYLSRG